MHICVYCSSSSAVAEGYFEAARELGRLLGERGHTLVYGGANVGLMGDLASEAKGAGARIVGVMPRKLAEHGLAYAGADEMRVTETMAERKAAMESLAEAFIAMPGGFGTLEELLQVLTLKQLGYLDAPIVLLNTAGIYEHLLAHWERLYGEHFAKAAYRSLYYVACDPIEALDHVENAPKTALPQKWF